MATRRATTPMHQSRWPRTRPSWDDARIRSRWSHLRKASLHTCLLRGRKRRLLRPRPRTHLHGYERLSLINFLQTWIRMMINFMRLGWMEGMDVGKWMVRGRPNIWFSRLQDKASMASAKVFSLRFYHQIFHSQRGGVIWREGMRISHMRINGKRIRPGFFLFFFL